MRRGRDATLRCVRCGNRIAACNRLASTVANLQRLADIQAVRGRDVVALRQIAEIIAGNPGDVEQRIAAFYGIGIARVTTFRNVLITAVVYDTAILRLNIIIISANHCAAARRRRYGIVNHSALTRGRRNAA